MAQKIFRKRMKKPGLPPGTLVHIGEKKLEKVRITFLDYNDHTFTEQQVDSIETCYPLRDTRTVSWINIDGLHDVDLIRCLGEHFGIHPLIQEDVVDTEHRPKIEDMGDYLFLILKMIRWDEQKNEIQSEQVSFLLGLNYVITFQEQPGDVFESIRERIRTHSGRIRKMGNDYLVYSLMDAVVDEYFAVLENLGEKIQNMEEEVLSAPNTETIQKLHRIKNQLLFLRKSVWPLREVITNLERSESKLIKKQTIPYFRDMYDNTIQIIDMMETMRDMNSGLFDMYLSSLSNKMNEVMKVLTIIATIFIPLTFIVGVYGMNFRYMPELGWKWGYFAVLSVMLVVALGMILFFRKKKWM
jgi:magnesium transporter